MSIVAGAFGPAAVIASVAALAVVGRLLPPGRGRELAGFIPNCAVLLRRLRADRCLPRRALWPGNPDHLDRLLGRPKPVQDSVRLET